MPDKPCSICISYAPMAMQLGSLGERRAMRQWRSIVRPKLAHVGLSTIKKQNLGLGRKALARPFAKQLHQARTRIAKLRTLAARAHEVVHAFDHFQRLVRRAGRR